MESFGYSFFQTPIGRCAIVFGPQGIKGVCLPERTVREARARVKARYAEAREVVPTGVAADAMDRIVALLSGKPVALASIPLDMRGLPPFHVKVYQAARSIGPGETLSYGEVAERLGSPGSARAVGQALSRNPFAVVVPCHRVLGAKGKMGGFTAAGGLATKQQMLLIEQGMATHGAAPSAPSAPSPEHVGDELKRAIRHLRRSDPTLAKIIDDVGMISLERAAGRSAFLALAEAIVYQQLTGKAAATIFGRVKALYPKSRSGPSPQQVLATPDDTLRAAGLSRAKVLALKDLAEKANSGALPTLTKLEKMDDATIIAKLTTVRGIGEWSAQMFLIFRLGRPDVLPLDDLGVRKGFAVLTGTAELPTKQALAAYGAKWAPYRTVASLYAWRAADRARKATQSEMDG